MSTLRLIAVHVEEPAPRRFVWVLTERSGDGWRVLAKDSASEEVYSAAMAAGLRALQAMVADLASGPRHADDRSGDVDGDSDSAMREADATQREATPASATRKTSHFGFGPAR